MSDQEENKFSYSQSEIDHVFAVAVQRGGRSERADVLAFLRKRQAAAIKVGGHNPEEAERARIIAGQIGIEIEMIERGLHVGDAALMAVLEGAV